MVFANAERNRQVIDYSKFRFGNWTLVEQDEQEHLGKKWVALRYLGQSRATRMDGEVEWFLAPQSAGDAESTFVALAAVAEFEKLLHFAPKAEPPKGYEWRQQPGGVRLVKVDGGLEEYAGHITTLEQAYVARALSDGYIEMCGARCNELAP
jgi:hypothetical protein